MKKKLYNIILAAVLTGALLTGCSFSEVTSDNIESAVVSDTASDTLSALTEDAAEESEDTSSAVSSNSDTTTSSKAAASSESGNVSSEKSGGSSEVTIAEVSLNTSGILDTSDMFSERDLKQSADTSSAKSITVSDGKTIDITEEGVYVISGSAKNCTIRVNADAEAKVQLVLNGVTISNDSEPVICVLSADKCFVTTTDSKNTLSVTGTFSENGDAVIYSKDDLVLNGTGTLSITSSENGISGKDDIKITGGTYIITSNADAVEANDSIRICGGTFDITTSKDAFHSENDEDDSKGYIFVSDGTFTIRAASDAFQAISAVQIDGGTFDITAAEGIEGTYIQINDGAIGISASDDGINASRKSSSYATPTVEVNGGELTIVMGQGDTDAVDANGNIIVNGGTIDITAQVSSFDYDGTAEYNGGTIIINGSQVNSIPQSMMGGGMGGMGGMGGRGGMMGGFGGRGF